MLKPASGGGVFDTCRLDGTNAIHLESMWCQVLFDHHGVAPNNFANPGNSIHYLGRGRVGRLIFRVSSFPERTLSWGSMWQGVMKPQPEHYIERRDVNSEWWRRRESNPGPRTFPLYVYMLFCDYGVGEELESQRKNSTPHQERLVPQTPDPVFWNQPVIV